MAAEIDSTRRELIKLRDGFIGRIPPGQRSVSVKFAWQEVWSKVSRYLSRDELIQLGEALIMAANAHGEQKRSSGEPYVIHCVHVASILSDMQMDIVTLIAALLHDTLEDTELSKDDMFEKFGEGVVTLVDGVTKLGKLSFKSYEDYQAENLRKMFLVMAKDIRVVLIKLADRTHNMRTLGVLRKDKQMRIAKETLDIYAPLAHRLGIYQIKRTLEDLAFKYYDPDMYYEIKKKVRKRLPEREAIVKEAMEMLQKKVDEHNIDVQIKGRAKHFYSIFEKMNRKKLSIDQLYDLLALRVIVNDVTQCYTVLGIVHTIWKPIPGEFDDYIANPKNNMYQSLHTTVVGPTGEPLEVQIRTWEMHWMAEYGIAAHWRYKEGASKFDALDERLEWIRKALEGGSETKPEEFMERLKDDVLTSDVFVFTPKGDVISLPRGSTPIDFAYYIHTQVGNQCVGAMVNNRIVSTDYKLQNGDIVKVITSPQGTPSRDWINIVRSNKAKSKIRSYFKQQDTIERAEHIQRGRELLNREIKRRRHNEITSVDDAMADLNHIARDIGYQNGEDVLCAVGTNNQAPSAIANRLFSRMASEAVEAPAPSVENRSGLKMGMDIIVEGAGGVLVSMANCCMPVPGDPIVGYSTRIRGITVHRVDCQNIRDANSDRIIKVSWGIPKKKKYPTRLKLDALDRPGLFSDVAQAVAAAEADITGIKASQVGGSHARMKIEIKVRNLEHLYSVVAKLNTVRNVIEVSRG